MRENIVQNYTRLLSEVRKVCRAEKIDEPKIVAVSKHHSADRVEQLIGGGCAVFGENKVQEARAKFEHLKEKYPDIELHFIGKLQRNKVKDAVRIFDYIHTIDSLKLAEKVFNEMCVQKKWPRCFLQINTGSEPQKTGLHPEDVVDFVSSVNNRLDIPIVGLMCIPPRNEEASVHFRFLQTLSQELSLPALSMGMSSDYLDAIRCGATHLRIGTTIFGKREVHTDRLASQSC